MATKLKSTNRRTSMKDISTKAKTLSSRDKKKIQGGLLPYVEQENLKNPSSSRSITDGTSNITDGTSNTIVSK